MTSQVYFVPAKRKNRKYQKKPTLNPSPFEGLGISIDAHSKAPLTPPWDGRSLLDNCTTFNYRNPGTWEERFTYCAHETGTMGSICSYSRGSSSAKDQTTSAAKTWVDLFNTATEGPISPTVATRWLPKPAVSSPKRRMSRASKGFTDAVKFAACNYPIGKQSMPSVSIHSWATIQCSRDRVDASLPPRKILGLLNDGNICFMNVILQSLLSCEPFRKLALASNMEEGTLIQKFSILAWEMSECHAGPTTLVDEPLLPDWFFNIFPPSAPSIGGNGPARRSQEDAEEFLSFILNALHEESISKREAPDSPERTNSSCRDGWERSGIHDESSISSIFGGLLLNEVRKPFQLPRVTEESFFSLSLEIESGTITSIDHAIRSYFQTEILGDAPGASGLATERQVFLDRTPEVLILHLKRSSFNMSTGASMKLMKDITYPEVLHLPESVRRDDLDRCAKRFELAAVVVHRGRSLADGHYVCYVRFWHEDGSSVWVSCDDSKTCEVSLEHVLQKQAYLLFYIAI